MLLVNKSWLVCNSIMMDWRVSTSLMRANIYRVSSECQCIILYSIAKIVCTTIAAGTVHNKLLYNHTVIYCVPTAWLGAPGFWKVAKDLANLECTYSYLLCYLAGYQATLSVLLLHFSYHRWLNVHLVSVLHLFSFRLAFIQRLSSVCSLFNKKRMGTFYDCYCRLAKWIDKLDLQRVRKEWNN